MQMYSFSGFVTPCSWDGSVEQTRGFFDFSQFSDLMADYYNKNFENRKIELQLSEREENFKDLKWTRWYCVQQTGNPFNRYVLYALNILYKTGYKLGEYVKPFSCSTVLVFS